MKCETELKVYGDTKKLIECFKPETSKQDRSSFTIKEGKDSYRIEMPEYGHFLDSAPGHWVPLFEPNSATGPYKGNIKHAIAGAKRSGFDGDFVWMQGKRWIRLGLVDARKRLKEKINKGHTTRLIRRKAT